MENLNEKEKELTIKAKFMLVYIACINYAMYGLESELRASGKYRHKVAHYFKIAQKIANDAHNNAYAMFASGENNVGPMYNEEFDRIWAEIDECVLLPDSEKDYNIIMALSRIVGKLTKEIEFMYYFPLADHITRIPSLLNGLEIEDYKVDNIIERNIKIK